MSQAQEHWNRAYSTKAENEVSWFQRRPEKSLALIEAAAPDRSVPIIDVGGGASMLVDELVRAGYADVSVLDISEAALARSKARLGAKADGVSWIVADITSWRPERTWGVWHDRAAFHFLTDAARQATYIEALKKATAPGSVCIIATFALDGPERCSGLPVQRYSAATLAARLGTQFEPAAEEAERHVTPGGAVQSFVYSVFKRR
jgi:SAM-dependent methyltransferase